MTVTDLLGTYLPPAGVYDEMLAIDGRVREDWAQLRHSLDELGLVELHRRRDEAARLLEADGVSYHASGRPSRSEQRWRLDPVPALIGSEEWGSLERGVIQRAELLALVLEDLYGPRDLVRRGLLPAEVVFSDPEFLRAADGIRTPGAALASYAVDMARDRDGSWWVLSDRAQAPSGAGYALENRLVVSRVLPSLYRDAQVHRLAPFFRALRSALQDAAPPHTDDPRIVVLTPGRWSETAFEHAYLASYLGYSLVEGADLTVREGALRFCPSCPASPIICWANRSGCHRSVRGGAARPRAEATSWPTSIASCSRPSVASRGPARCSAARSAANDSPSCVNASRASRRCGSAKRRLRWARPPRSPMRDWRHDEQFCAPSRLLAKTRSWPCRVGSRG
jgi:hypothetical protein